MSCALRWTERPDGIVGKAYEEATEILRAWANSPGNEAAAALVIWWPAVDLCERIATALLAQRGYDEDLLDMATDGGPYPNGWSAGDLDAELERTRER